MAKKKETEKGTTTKAEPKDDETKARGPEPKDVISAKDAKKVNVTKKK